MLERLSPIALALAAGNRPRDGAAGVHLGEVRGWSLLQVAGFRGAMAPVEQAVQAAASVTVPGTIGPAARGADLLVMRTGPEQVWIVGAGERLAAEDATRAAVAAAGGVSLSLSHSRARLFLDGPRARDVLAKDVALDLDPSVFGIDQIALTGFDHTPVLLHRAAAERYEIYAMRTFALTVWERLADAALEFGYEIV